MMLPYIIIIVKLCSLCVNLVPKAGELSCFCKLTTSWIIPFIIMIMYLKCMWVLHHCLEHSTGFQLKRGSNTKLLACAFSVSLTTLCHLAFLTFFIHKFLTSVWRPLAEDLSLFLAPLSGIPYLYLSEKLSVFQLSKRS